ncbi:MAG: hypothetical protein KDB53_19410, partial [Planctomycetes bacterium]|nr:hypothetical protein [Planctomycetota bacterium]
FARMSLTRHELVVAARDKILRLDRSSLHPRDWISSPDGEAISAALSPDDAHLYIGRYPRTLEIRRAADDWAPTIFQDEGESEINTVAPSPDGSLLVTTSRHRVTLRDAGGVPLAMVPQRAYSATWSPDGRRILVGGDGDITIFDRELQRIAHRVGHRGEVLAIRFVPDSELYFSVAKDGSICKWQALQPSPIFRKRAHHDGILACEVGPDFAVTKGRDGYVRILSLDEGEVIAEYQEASTMTGWCVGMALDVDASRLFIPGEGERRLRILEFDRDRLLFARMHFLFGMQSRLDRVGPAGSARVTKRARLVPLLFDDQARLLAHESAATSPCAARLGRAFRRLRLHGLTATALSETVGLHEDARRPIIRALNRASWPGPRGLWLLLLAPETQARSARLALALLEPRTSREALVALGQVAPNINDDVVISALWTLVRQGDEATAAQASHLMEHCVPRAGQNRIADQILHGLGDHEANDEALWRDLRALRRLSWIMQPEHTHLLFDGMQHASPSLRFEIMQTLGIAAQAGLVRDERLIRLMEAQADDRPQLAVALRRTPGFPSRVLRDRIGAWQQSSDQGLREVAVWLDRQTRRPSASPGTPRAGLLDDEDVLDREFLASLRGRPYAEIPGALVGRVLRLIWLPFAMRSDAARSARRLADDWIRQGARPHLSFRHESARRHRTRVSQASILATEELRSTFLRHAGLEPTAWREKVRRELTRCHAGREFETSRHWARILVDFDRLEHQHSPISDTAMAMSYLGTNDPRFKPHLDRARAENHSLRSRHERQSHLDLIRQLEDRAGG